jgi:hypothetical protein
MLPPSQLLDVVRSYANKVYFHLSNYSKNILIVKFLKYDAFITILKESGIKHQMAIDLMWNREEPLMPRSYTVSALRSMFNNCWLARCTQILASRLSLCPRLSSGYALGCIGIIPEESIDLQACDRHTFKDDLINFYKKDYFEACRNCIRIDEQVIPAVQLDKSNQNLAHYI